MKIDLTPKTPGPQELAPPPRAFTLPGARYNRVLSCCGCDRRTRDILKIIFTALAQSPGQDGELPKTRSPSAPGARRCRG